MSSFGSVGELTDTSGSHLSKPKAQFKWQEGRLRAVGGDLCVR